MIPSAERHSLVSLNCIDVHNPLDTWCVINCCCWYWYYHRHHQTIAAHVLNAHHVLFLESIIFDSIRRKKYRVRRISNVTKFTMKTSTGNGRNKRTASGTPHVQTLHWLVTEKAQSDTSTTAFTNPSSIGKR